MDPPSPPVVKDWNEEDDLDLDLDMSSLNLKDDASSSSKSSSSAQLGDLLPPPLSIIHSNPNVPIEPIAILLSTEFTPSNVIFNELTKFLNLINLETEDDVDYYNKIAKFVIDSALLKLTKGQERQITTKIYVIEKSIGERENKKLSTIPPFKI